jgi:Xaa-Pro aminopeptidase
VNQKVRTALAGASLLGSLLTLCPAFVQPVSAQYTDIQALNELGGPKEFERRRSVLGRQMKEGWLVMFARIGEPEGEHYREDNDFYYLTGIADPGSVLLLDAHSGRSILFEPAQSQITKKFLGPNLLALLPVEQEKLGFREALPLSDLDKTLSSVLSDGGTLWLRMGFPDQADEARDEVGADYALRYSAPYHPPLPFDRSVIEQLRSRYPQATLRDVTPLLDEMRNIKTPHEIAVLRKNGRLSAEALRDAIAHAKPDMYEYQIEARARFGFLNAGAQGNAYAAIVSSGTTLNTWHYFQDRKQIPANTLVVIDYGADLHHQTMDITRTFNISGKFTGEQAKWYAVCLEAQQTVIRSLRPGLTFEQAMEAGRKVYERAGIADQWLPSFPGHFVGLATHDGKRPMGPIKAGQVIAVEPLIEFPDKQLHFRVEDTVLITEGAAEVLSAAVPKELKEVEALVGSAKQDIGKND